MPETYTTLGQSTLASGYTTGGTSLDCASGSSFPATGNFRVKIDDEIFKVTARTGGTLTVVGAQEGTNAANHATGAVVTEVLTAAALDAIRSDMSSIGPIASRPSSGMKAGNRYKCTDSPYEYIFDGSVWQPFVFGYNVVEPVLADFTQVRVDLSTLSAAHGGILWSAASAASSNKLQVLAQAIPGSGAYYVDAAFIQFSTASNGVTGVGLSAGTASTDGVAFVSQGFENTSIWSSQRELWASTTSFTNTQGAKQMVLVGPLIWVRVYDDRVTNRTFYISMNGYDWYQVYQESRTTGFTPAQAVLALQSFAGDEALHFVHFSIHA